MSKNTGGFIGQDGIKAPDPATGVSGASGQEKVVVSFTAPENVGGSAITGYRAQSNDGIGSSGSASPITVSGLTGATSYTFNVWAINAFGWSSPSDASAAVVPAAAPTPYGLFFSGYGTGVSAINQITFASLGNATDIGDLSIVRATASQGSATRAVISTFRNSASDSPANAGIDLIEYVTFGTAGNATDFGNLTLARWAGSSVGNSTRCCFSGGYPTSGASNVIDYVTIATTGNAIDFGDTTVANGQSGGLASPTRGVTKTSSGNIIEYITTATTGNATDFGDGTQSYYDTMGASSSTRGLFAGGYSGGAIKNIDYITIATTGNAADFGDLTINRQGYSSGASNNITAVFAGDTSASMEKVTIATLGNGTSFGNLTQATAATGCSNVHGGLQ